ncbi:EAL and HDOD domain-containing protein [Reinekea sp.]|uniref:EAL and HDOD domain-containing protein n=1 Tax=Reinekea sp. TaxID=1970455 RepID=UPI0039895D86
MQSNVLFARQPILDRSQEVFAYELLFRNGTDDHAEFVDGDLATRSVLLSAFADNSAPQLLNGKPGLLNIRLNMASNLPDFAVEFLYVEILETEHNLAILDHEIEMLTRRGFRVALDDFEMKNYRPELINAVDIVKLDVLAMTREELCFAVDQLSKHNVLLLAEKVETYEVFHFCESLGFDYFQGYYFCRPELVTGHVLNANRKSLFDLLLLLYKPDDDIAAISQVIKRDAVLSYKLLKLVNSSFYRRATTVESIEHAVMLLGLQRIRSWATLVCLGELNDKPQELQTESFMRATMCEALGANISPEMAQKCFSVGMLSSLDAWFDQPLVELLSRLPLSAELNNALINREGALGVILSTCLNYIHTHWDLLPENGIQSLGLGLTEITKAYEESIIKTDEMTLLMREN